MSLEKLVFDVTDANTIADSHSVGAYVRSSDGTLITHSTVGGKEALDVSIADGINVEVDLAHTDDSVRLGDGTSFFTSTSENSDIALDVHISNTSIAVTDGGGSLTVDAVDLDIRDLTAASDSVQSNMFDGAGTALTSTLVSGDQALDVNVVQISTNDDALADTAIKQIAKMDKETILLEVILIPFRVYYEVTFPLNQKRHSQTHIFSEYESNYAFVWQAFKLYRQGDLHPDSRFSFTTC